MTTNTHIKVLWLAPNLNHYKVRLLSHLADDALIDLCVFYGSGIQHENVNESSFKQIKVEVDKRNFGTSKLVKAKLKSIFSQFDWIMIPVEKKNISLFLYACKLRRTHENVMLFSYNHPELRSRGGRITFIDRWLTKFFFKRLDRIVFYTEQSAELAIKNEYVSEDKAFWANNTLDNAEIQKQYDFQLPPKDEKVIVFISRLAKRKHIPELLQYYFELKTTFEDLKLEIIGDGPERHHVESAVKTDSDITWHGTLIDEKDIAPIMTRASFVFVPGHSGLSVNHAFAYGRPYVTLAGTSHAPEINYIDIGLNGYVLLGDFESNVNTLINLLTNRSVLERFCKKAKQKGEYLSAQNWVDQMKRSLT